MPRKLAYQNFIKIARLARAKRRKCRLYDDVGIEEHARREIFALLKAVELYDDDSFTLAARCHICTSLGEVLCDIRQLSLAEMVLDWPARNIRTALQEEPLNASHWQLFLDLIRKYKDGDLLDAAADRAQELLSHLDQHVETDFTEEQRQLMLNWEKTMSFEVISDDTGAYAVQVPQPSLTEFQVRWCEAHSTAWTASTYVEQVREELVSITQRRNDRKQLELAISTMFDRLDR